MENRPADSILLLVDSRSIHTYQRTPSFLKVLKRTVRIPMALSTTEVAFFLEVLNWIKYIHMVLFINDVKIRQKDQRCR